MVDRTHSIASNLNWADVTITFSVDSEGEGCDELTTCHDLSPMFMKDDTTMALLPVPISIMNSFIPSVMAAVTSSHSITHQPSWTSLTRFNACACTKPRKLTRM